jgi:hypothetical protein
MAHPWTTQQRDDLKSCPFCGTSAIEQARLADNLTATQWRIQCGNPFCECICQSNICASLPDTERAWQERDVSEIERFRKELDREREVKDRWREQDLAAEVQIKLAHSWFERHFGEEMNGLQIETKCSMADRAIERLTMDAQFGQKCIQDSIEGALIEHSVVDAKINSLKADIEYQARAHSKLVAGFTERLQYFGGEIESRDRQIAELQEQVASLRSSVIMLDSINAEEVCPQYVKRAIEQTARECAETLMDQCRTLNAEASQHSRGGNHEMALITERRADFAAKLAGEIKAKFGVTQ